MKKLKTLTTIFVVLSLALALTQNITAQTSDNMQTFFSRDYPGISIKVDATRETIPGENVTIHLWINCTADGVYVDYLYLSVDGFKHFRYGLEKITLNVTYMMKKKPLVFNHTSELNYTVDVPNDVWDATYAELRLKYDIKGLSLEYNPSFSITTVTNVLWEKLENQLKRLNASYQQLNNTYCQLNQTFWESFQMNLTAENLALLNQTYWDLRQNFTSLNQTYWDLKGSIGGLGTTRNVAIVLAITTVFFAATTIYLIMRKPKQYW